MDFTAIFGYGDMVRDEYSGFTGKVVAVCFYKTGCTQYCVNAGKLKEDGSPMDGEWLDETRLTYADTVPNADTVFNVVMSAADLKQQVQKLVAQDLQQAKVLDPRTAAGGPQRNAPAAD